MALFQKAILDNTNDRRNDYAMIERYSKRLERFAKSQVSMESAVSELQKLSEQLEVIINDYASREHDQQLNNTNLALDLKYLREQGDQLSGNLGIKMIDSVNTINTQLEKTNQEMEELKLELKRIGEAVAKQQKAMSQQAGRDRVSKGFQVVIELATAVGVGVILLKLFHVL